MPKETFFHLPEEKRKKIEEALKKEFSRISFDKASISHIIEEANIPRGSFYQYFEDKEDAVRYMIEKFMEMEKQKMRELIQEKKGDIFEISMSIFDYAIEQVQKNEEIKLCQNIMQELKNENKSLFEESKPRPHSSSAWRDIAIDQSKLNLEQEEDLKYIMKIITSTVRTAIIEVISGRISKEKGRIGLSRQLEILKRGMEKT